MCSTNDPKSRSSTCPTTTAGSTIARASGKRCPGEVAVALDQVNGAPDELELPTQGQVGRGAPDEDADHAGLDDPAVVGPHVGELLRGQPERHGTPLAGIEPDSTESPQLQDRASDGRLRIADIQLDHLVAPPAAGVPDIDRHDDLAAVGRQLR